MNGNFALTTQDLTKDYGSGQGLFDCNLEIAAGEVFGLIGPNGAGKSTLIKLLMDLVRPTRGSALIFGMDTQRESLKLKREIGYLPGELMQFPAVTAGYILNLLLNLRGISDRSTLINLADRLQLDLSRKFSDLSHGNKQKVGIIQAFMHKPKLLILDEPTLGLDPIIQRELQALVLERVNNGDTVLLSSHVLSEVEAYCSRIGLIDKGKIIKVGTLKDLRSSLVHKVSITFSGELPERNDLEAVGATNLEIKKDLIHFEVHGSITQILKLLSNYQVLEMDSRELSLEEVFFSEVKS